MSTDKHVLIVENDTGIANMIRAILGIVNVPVDHAQTGEGAEMILEKGDTGLVICKRDLPDTDAYYLLQYIRSDDDLKNIPVIMLVSEGDKKHEQLPKEKQADRYITRPFTARQVLDVIKDFIVYKGA